MWVFSYVLKITGYRRQKWGERAKSFISGHWCATGKIPVGEVWQTMANSTVWGGQTVQCLPKKWQSLKRAWQCCQTLGPSAEQAAVLSPLVLPLFLQMGWEEDSQVSSSCKAMKNQTPFYFWEDEIGWCFLSPCALLHNISDTNKICHSEGAEGDLVHAVMYVRNSLITSRVAYLPKTMAVSFRNHQCFT